MVVVGDRKLELVSQMLDQELQRQSPKRKHTHIKYLEYLSRLVGSPIIPEQPKSLLSRGSPAKFTKVLLTNSFWLHLHFFVHDNKIFDPFVSQACRGPVSICIIAASSSVDLTATKAYLHQPNPVRSL